MHRPGAASPLLGGRGYSSRETLGHGRVPLWRQSPSIQTKKDWTGQCSRACCNSVARKGKGKGRKMEWNFMSALFHSRSPLMSCCYHSDMCTHHARPKPPPNHLRHLLCTRWRTVKRQRRVCEPRRRRAPVSDFALRSATPPDENCRSHAQLCTHIQRIRVRIVVVY